MRCFLSISTVSAASMFPMYNFSSSLSFSSTQSRAWGVRSPGTEYTNLNAFSRGGRRAGDGGGRRV